METRRFDVVVGSRSHSRSSRGGDLYAGFNIHATAMALARSFREIQVKWGSKRVGIHVEEHDSVSELSSPNFDDVGHR
jgi:hypothetical protein